MRLLRNGTPYTTKALLAGGFILRYLIVMAAVPLTVAVPLL